jgi:hypothetical protein
MQIRNTVLPYSRTCTYSLRASEGFVGRVRFEPALRVGELAQTQEAGAPLRARDHAGQSEVVFFKGAV